MLIGAGVAWAAQILIAFDSMGARDVIGIAIGAVVAIAGCRLLLNRQDAWKTACLLALGLGSIRAIKAIFVAYITWPTAAAPTDTRSALISLLAWDAGLAIALAVAGVSILLKRRRV